MPRLTSSDREDVQITKSLNWQAMLIDAFCPEISEDFSEHAKEAAMGGKQKRAALRRHCFDGVLPVIENACGSLFKSLNMKEMKARNAKLLRILRQAADDSHKLWRQGIISKLLTLPHFARPFTIKDNELEPHPTMLLEEDDIRSDGWSIYLVVKPSIQVRGDAKGVFGKWRTLHAATVMLASAKDVENVREQIENEGVPKYSISVEISDDETGGSDAAKNPGNGQTVQPSSADRNVKNMELIAGLPTDAIALSHGAGSHGGGENDHSKSRPHNHIDDGNEKETDSSVSSEPASMSTPHKYPPLNFSITIDSHRDTLKANDTDARTATMESKITSMNTTGADRGRRKTRDAMSEYLPSRPTPEPAPRMERKHRLDNDDKKKRTGESAAAAVSTNDSHGTGKQNKAECKKRKRSSDQQESENPKKQAAEQKVNAAGQRALS